MPGMIGGSAHTGLDFELQQKRAALAAKPGAAGLVKNARTTAIAVFASMGGLIYGYNQGMFGQVLSMHSFGIASGTDGISNPTLAGLLTSILELGAWVGVLANGYSADRLGRKLSVVVACAFFIVGVIVQAVVHGGNYDYILAGRFITGLGVGSLSMIVPLYNAEVAPAEIRGALVALQQLAITFGIMISYWITYGECLRISISHSGSLY
jgi:MFS family permease